MSTVTHDDTAGHDVQGQCSNGSGASPGYLLPLLQLSDSALPTGAFSHSFGMESYLADGTVADEATFAAWLRAYVSRQLTYTDGVAIRMVYDALHLGDLDAIWRLDLLLAALTLPEQVRTAAATIGRRTAEVGSVVAPESFLGDYLAELDAGRCHGHPAVAFAVLAHAIDAPPAAAIEAHLFAAVTSLTQNAVRAIPIGQTAGQRVQRAMHDVVADAVATALTLTEHDLGAASPGLEIAQMRHRRQRARMFMS
ncbi:urease accessory protein [Tsukamurella pulmonis]|uniref:Urease accessory protein UreF n=1 Tax=Tsukamurella pulmonis TaxID=47312 RepID=A0A1H1DRZ9_9ACTN|nr:urease accessory protein UreF [Tsukamurella pulmonis]SDQ79207.1 urease accessory protein [Tsukamurella pulmonis]SUP21756.1 Urease accessory protein UreF [Tsukamurella pulmonis]